MIEHLLWAKDGDGRLGTRDAYEVASAFGNSQTGHSGHSLVSVRAGLHPGQALMGCSLWYTPLTPATLLSVTPPPSFACGSNLCPRCRYAVSPLSTEAQDGIFPSFLSLRLAHDTQNHLYHFLLPTPTQLLMVKGPSHGATGSSFILRSQGVLYNSLLNH